MNASCFTNRKRIVVESLNTKVQQPTKQSVNYVPLYSSRPCNPDYTVIQYVIYNGLGSLRTIQR